MFWTGRNLTCITADLLLKFKHAGTGNVGLLIITVIIFNWLLSSANWESDETLAALHTYHWLQFMFWCIERVRRMKAKVCKDYVGFAVFCITHYYEKDIDSLIFHVCTVELKANVRLRYIVCLFKLQTLTEGTDKKILMVKYLTSFWVMWSLVWRDLPVKQPNKQNRNITSLISSFMLLL